MRRCSVVHVKSELSSTLISRVRRTIEDIMTRTPRMTTTIRVISDGAPFEVGLLCERLNREVQDRKLNILTLGITNAIIKTSARTFVIVFASKLGKGLTQFATKFIGFQASETGVQENTKVISITRNGIVMKASSK
jgi:hypothetical protein